MKKILVVDNYDSFVYNIVYFLEELGGNVVVKRNDQIDIEEVAFYDKILLSPGPGVPDEAGLLKEIIKQYHTTKSILGVCLGHQAIGEVFGGTLTNLSEPFHGVATTITQNLNEKIMFQNLPTDFVVGRYHSWVVDKQLPDCLEATSVDAFGNIMSLQHKNFDVRGVQFHPESVLTPQGKTMLENWMLN